jgi:hypothetical protein
MKPWNSRAYAANLVYGDVDFLAVWLMPGKKQNEQGCLPPHLKQ